MRYLGGFISASYNPLKVPNAPTIGVVTAGNAQVSVAFTAPSNVGGGAITSYIAIAQSAAGALFSATGSASPLTVTGLTNNTAYTVQVCAVNTYGPGPYSTGTSGTPIPPTNLYSWGLNSQGQLGQNNLIYRSSPVQVGADGTWADIATRGGFTFVTKTTGSLWCWGSNNVGQLGLNDKVYRSSPVQIGALTTWASLYSSGSNNGYAIKTDGTFWAWGANGYGQLGQNNTIYRSSPVQVGTDTNWARIAGGAYHVLAVKTTGTLWSWGDNGRGQLGQNIAYTVKLSSPVQVGSGTTWSKVACCDTASIATKTDGTMWSWGYNNNGQLGLNTQGTYTERSSPVQIGSLTTWANVFASGNAVIAIKTDGTMWSWGFNGSGQLAQNNRVYRSSPTQIGALTTWSSVSVGTGDNVGALKTDGTLWAWGYNQFGGLGVNDTTTRSSPIQVGAATSWTKISAGGIIMVGIRS